MYKSCGWLISLEHELVLFAWRMLQNQLRATCGLCTSLKTVHDASHLNDEDNLVRSRSAEAHLMSPRIHTTHRLTVQRAAQPPMVTMP